MVLVDIAGFGNRALAGEADVTEAERTVRLVEGWPGRPGATSLPGCLLNRVKRTRLARHALGEIETAGLSVLSAVLTDLIAYGEMSYSGRVPEDGPAEEEITRLVAELRRSGGCLGSTWRTAMRAPLKQRKPSPAEVVRIATETAPTLPPAQMPLVDKPATFTMRLKASTLAAIEAAARQEGATLKQRIMRAVERDGIEVAASDLEDGTPRRRAA